MNRIIFSFKPEIFPALLTKEKQFEYRSRLPDGDLEAYIYLSSPIKMIVGKMKLGQRLRLVDLIQEVDAEYKRDLERHIEEGSNYCSPILSLSLFATPVTLAEAKRLSPNFSAPQGFLYLSNHPALRDKLENIEMSVYEINPTQSKAKLGLYSTEIIKEYPPKIQIPAYLTHYVR